LSTVGIPVLFLLFLGYERKVGVLAAILWPLFFCKVFYHRHLEIRDKLINRSNRRCRLSSCGSCWCRPQDNLQGVLSCLLCFCFWFIVAEEEVVYGRRPCSLSFIFAIQKKGWPVGCHPLALAFLRRFFIAVISK